MSKIERSYLVDQQGLPTGETILYGETPPNPESHILVTGVLLIDEYDRLLIQQRSHSKKLAPGCWTLSASGHPQVPESPIIGMRREIFEELGILMSAESLQGIGSIDQHLESGRLQVMYYYLDRISSQTNITPNKTEVQSWRFVTKAELAEMIEHEPLLGGIHKPILDRYLQGEFDSFKK